MVVVVGVAVFDVDNVDDVDLVDVVVFVFGLVHFLLW